MIDSDLIIWLLISFMFPFLCNAMKTEYTPKNGVVVAIIVFGVASSCLLIARNEAKKNIERLQNESSESLLDVGFYCCLHCINFCSFKNEVQEV